MAWGAVIGAVASIAGSAISSKKEKGESKESGESKHKSKSGKSKKAKKSKKPQEAKKTAQAPVAAPRAVDAMTPSAELAASQRNSGLEALFGSVQSSLLREGLDQAFQFS